MVYAGELEVEEGDFTLNAKRFITREDEISFLFEGIDEYGGFLIEGIAEKSSHGFYIAPKCELKYSTYSSDDKASVRIDSVELSPKRNKCKISGLWIQDGDSWGFSGTLSKFNA